MMIPRINPLLLLLLLPVAAIADNPTVMGRNGDWTSFVTNEKGGKVCFMASTPKHSLNAPKGRGGAHFTITHRTSDKSADVVSLSLGTAIKKDSIPELEVGIARFNLYAINDSAWSRDDKPVIAALQRAKLANFKALPVKGDPITDSYSLDGFAKSYAEISKACGLTR